MSNDYTKILPPVPRAIAGGFLQPAVEAVEAYGHACAEHVRAEMTPRVVAIIKERDAALARIAELEATLSGKEAAWAFLNRSIGRLRAEVEAKAGEVEALRAVLTECADDLEAEVNARASGDLPRRIERDLEPVRKARALLAQPAGEWVNPLAAEVEALRADAERYRWIKAQGHKGPFYFSKTGQVDRDELDAAIDAARKGASQEADEGAEGDRLGEGSEG